jgi:hypothetical protein
MEMQRQRERYASRTTTIENISDWLKKRHDQSMQISAARSLQRLKKLGVIVHYIRPPEAMVRYFGSERGSATSEEQSELGGEAGPNYHRDRLILEATRTQRALLPHIPVWLVTGDANLSIQAKVEDFYVGYSWLPELSGTPVLTSPYLEPRTLTPQHLAVEEFLDEWLWNWEKMTLQPSGQAKRNLWELPDRKSRHRTLLELNDFIQTTIETKRDKKCPRRTTGQVFKWQGDEDLANELGMGSKDIASQSVLANAFGLIVRLSGKSYKTAWKTPSEAADLIFNTARQLQQQAPHSGAVRVDKVFTTLLNTSPLSLSVFRAGLFELYTTKKIRLGGSIPDQEGKTATKMKALVPDRKELLEVNLGIGDFLIPNQSSQVIILEN